MTLKEAIKERHSVRRYKDMPLTDEVVKVLQKKIEEVNKKAGLHIQLIQNEPKAFKGVFAYGTFSGVNNYLVMAGPKGDDLDGKIGYFGEQIVLLAQTLGLNTCWVGLSYRKIKNTYSLGPNEKICCYIAIGYGENPGKTHKIKTIEEVSNVSDLTPNWFSYGVKAALLAPTAINQQKFYFEFILGNKVAAKPLFSIVGYTKIDLGIAKYHFEIGAFPIPVEWV